MKNIIYRIEFDLIELINGKPEPGAEAVYRRPETGNGKSEPGAEAESRRPETGNGKSELGVESEY